MTPAARLLLAVRIGTLAMLGAVGVEGALAAGGVTAQPAPEPSPRTSQRAEIVRRDCTTDQMRREVTLFGSGVVRVRDGVQGGEAAGIFQLPAQDFIHFLNRLQGEDLSEIGSLPQGPEGAWISRCVLTLELPGRERRSFSYGHYDRLPLNLSRVLRIVEEIEAKVPDIKISDRLPDDFLAQIGDLLRRADGAVFRVVAFTADAKGVRLEGQGAPLALYLTPEQVRHDFVALVQRDEPRR